MTTGDEGKVELPELPEGWTSETYKPWPGLSDKTITTWNKTWEIFEGREMVHSECNFLNDLLTAVYHPTNGLKQQLSDLRQRVREKEEEIAGLKLQLLQETGKDEHGAYSDEYDSEFNSH